MTRIEIERYKSLATKEFCGQYLHPISAIHNSVHGEAVKKGTRPFRKISRQTRQKKDSDILFYIIWPNFTTCKDDDTRTKITSPDMILAHTLCRI